MENIDYNDIAWLLYERVIKNIGEEAIELAYELNLIEDLSNESLAIVETIVKKLFTLKN